MVKRTELLQESVLVDIKAIDNTLSYMMLSCGIVVVLKFMSIPEFSLTTDIKLPTDLAWIIVFGLTFVHGFYAFRLTNAVIDLVDNVTHEEQVDTFHMIRATGGLFVKGLIPRIKVGHFRDMSIKDGSTWIAFFAAIALVLGVVPLRFENWLHFVLLWGAALLSIITNWAIGSYWIGMVSDLTLDKELFQEKRPSIIEMFAGEFPTARPVPFFVSALMMMCCYVVTLLCNFIFSILN
jgi:hypothetical protein